MEHESFLQSLSKKVGVELKPIASSNLVAIGFNVSTKDLWVLFKNNLLYQYKDINIKLYEELLKADSKGSYLRNNIISKNPSYKKFKVVT